MGGASSKDLALLVAYCPAMQQAIVAGGEWRSDLTGDLNLTTFAGQFLETYMGFISEDQRSVASRIYTGNVTVS